MALFPKKRYANMKGVYFLPTMETLKIWVRRVNFVDSTIIFSEALTVQEQRKTEWAPVHTSLNESLDPVDPSKTIEGYSAPHRFYLKCRKP
jgi:tRNA (mo5U34)-methyltransferase